MIINEYSRVIREHFDFTDAYTRRFVSSLEEAGQEQLIAALSAALYEKIVAKVDDIDFGTIPQSRGDITRVQGFANTQECLDIIRKLVIQYNQKTTSVDSIITAINNIRDRKDIFTKGFAVKAEMPMMIYNLIVLAIERSVSFIIATCIQFVKDPDSKNVKTALDKVAYEKTMDNMLFKQLDSFNTLCKNGTMDKTLKSSMTKGKSVNEEADIVGSILGREDDGSISDGRGSEVSMNPFDNDSAEDAHFPEDPSKFDTYNPNNVPNMQNIPVPNKEPEDDVVFDDEEDEDDHPMVAQSVKEMIPTRTTDIATQPPIVAAAVKDMFAAHSDTVEPENIPVVNHQDEVPGLMDEPINEDDLQENTTTDLIGAAAKGAAKFIGKNKKIIGAAAIAAGIISLPILAVKVIIPFIRTLAYYFYYTKMKLSDYLEIQASLIEANANDLENSTDNDLSEEKKKKVLEKQRKWADRLRKWSNMFDIDHKQAENNAKKESEKDSKEKRTVGQDEDGDDSIF